MKAGIATTVVGVRRKELLENNLEDAMNGLDEGDRKLLAELDRKFFAYQTTSQWESIDVANYWKALKEMNKEQNVDY